MASSVLPRPAAYPPSRPGHRASRPAWFDATRGRLEQQRNFRIDQLARLRHAANKGLLRGVELEINDSLAAGARAALRDVVDALQRLDTGTYGYCERCGTTLEAERLEIVPQVRLCLPCQRAAAA